MIEIKFGTDGWRGVIAREFTFDNLSVVAQATMDYLKQNNLADAGVVIGYDRRFLSREFAERTAEIAAGNAIKVYLTEGHAPTPAVSWAVYEKKAGSGVMITASHNPPEYNGFKIKENFGGSARPSTTKEIEKIVASNQKSGRTIESIRFDQALSSGKIEYIEPLATYLSQIRKYIDLDLINRSGIRVAVDPMHGAGSGCFAKLLDSVSEIHGEHNPGFRGVPPEPTPDHLAELGSFVRDGGYTVGLALDGDADRIGAVDENGDFFSSHMIFTVVLKHLVVSKKLIGGVVKTVSTTRMVDLLAEKYGLKLYETPIGFKHICELMLSEDILMGGEESGGLGVKGHIPERDGVLLGLLLLESIAMTGKGVRAQLDEIMSEIGRFFYNRLDLHIDIDAKKLLIDKLNQSYPENIAGLGVVSTNFSDGFKFFFEDNSWLLIRPSGTEPVLRLYAEASSEQRVQQLLCAARDTAGI